MNKSEKLARELWARFRQLIHEAAKFGVVGTVGFIVTETGFNLLHFDAGLGLFTSNALATGVAAVITFTGNKFWTFRRRAGRGTSRETVVFFGLNAVGALIQYACVWIAKNGFGATDQILINVAFFFGIVLGTLFRFWSYRTWVWHVPLEHPSAGRPEGEQADLVRGR